LVLACSLLSRHRANAQSTTSLIPDATVLVRGGFGIGVASAWTRWDELLGGPGGPRNMASSLNTDSLGSAAMPQLGAAENAIRTLSGTSTFVLTAGTLVGIGNARVVTAPLLLRYGVTSRLTLGVVVPVVEARTTLYSQLNRHPGSANVGPNPALLNPGLYAANKGLVDTLLTHATALQNMLTSCQATPTGTGCAALLQNPANVQALIQKTNTFASGIETLYGIGAAHPGQPLVPLNGGTAQTAINNQISGLSTAYQAFGGTPIVSALVGAGGVAANADLQALLIAIGRDTTGSVDRTSVGDISIGANLQLLDTYGDSTPAEARGTHARLAINATYRIGSGQPANRNRLFDMSTGYGQPGVLLGAAGDVQRGNFSMTAATTYTMQFGTINVSRLANPGNSALPLDVFPLDSGGTYSAGNVLEVDVVPRYRIANFLAATAHYSLVRTGADQYTLRPIRAAVSGEAEASLLGLGAAEATAQQVGIGFTYSTIVGPARYHGRLPVEVTFTHLETIAGTGGPVAKTFRDQIDVRVYIK
jgi:hypothetical protein